LSVNCNIWNKKLSKIGFNLGDHYIDIIKYDATLCCSKNEVEDILKSIKIYIENYKYPNELKNIYDFTSNFESHDEYEKIPKESIIGKWVNKQSDKYFCVPTEEEEAYEVDIPNFTYDIFYHRQKTKTKYRTIISGYRNTVSLSYDLIKVNAEPQHPNLHRINCTTSILISKKSIVFFYFFTKYKEQSWGKYKIIEDIEWTYTEHSLKNKDEILKSLEKILVHFTKYTNDYLIKKFKPNSEH